jgi:hypothetical protein
MLGAIGEDPVSDLENLPPSGNTAHAVLQAVSRDFQEEGGWYNHETSVVLTPRSDGLIEIPGGILDIDGTATSDDFIERRPYLYDRGNKTLVFTGPALCDVTYFLEWDSLPQVVRRVIIAQAIEKFLAGIPGASSEAASPARQRNLLRAELAYKKAELRNSDYNLLDNSSIQTANQRGA